MIHFGREEEREADRQKKRKRESKRKAFACRIYVYLILIAAVRLFFSAAVAFFRGLTCASWGWVFGNASQPCSGYIRLVHNTHTHTYIASAIFGGWGLAICVIVDSDAKCFQCQSAANWGA